MVQESIYGQMEEGISDNIIKTSNKVMESIQSIMVVFIQVVLKKEKCMDWEFIRNQIIPSNMESGIMAKISNIILKNKKKINKIKKLTQKKINNMKIFNNRLISYYLRFLINQMNSNNN